MQNDHCIFKLAITLTEHILLPVHIIYDHTPHCLPSIMYNYCMHTPNEVLCIKTLKGQTHWKIPVSLWLNINPHASVRGCLGSAEAYTK